jgi:hypothetical protein
MKNAALGQTITVDFTTAAPTTGAAATASAVTVRVFEDANDTAILTPAATERSGYAGNYRAQVACTTANGFEAGKSYNVVVEATVDGVTARAVVASFVLGPPVYYGSVVADGSNAASTFKTDLTESVTDHWKDALLVFVTGSLAGQVKKVSAFNPTTDFVTVSAAFTGAPSAADRFFMVVL